MRAFSNTHRAFTKVAFMILGVGNLVACNNPAPGEAVEHQPMEKPMPVIVSAPEALQTPDITTTDPGTMDEAEVRKVLPIGFQCRFAYTAESPPILAGVFLPGRNVAQGVTKIHGRLVEVTSQSLASEKELIDGAVFVAQGLKFEVKPDPNDKGESYRGLLRRQADLVFQLEQGLRVGYRGWYDCGNKS